MKCFAFTLALATVLFSVASIFVLDGASAQVVRESDAPIGRYKIKVYQVPNRSVPGYMIFDTTTGDVWRNNVHGKPEKLSTGLPGE